MLTDYRVIAQLVAQLSGLILMIGATGLAWQMLRKWNPNATTEAQLQLERRSFLVDILVRTVLFFQIASLILFVGTANHYLPSLIEGAMCATGTLALNEYGYTTLYLKIGGLFFYLIFLFIHQLDSREPNYPLTPFKYIFIFPSVLLIAIDSVTMIRYFYQIDPDVITTCCSVSILKSSGAAVDLLGSGKYLTHATIGFANLFFVVLAMLGFGKKRRGLLFLLSVAYVGAATYILKFYFVKYIYGLPSHNCLFDLFFAQYNFIGYVIFGSYFGLLATTLFSAVIRFCRPVLQQETARLEKYLKVLGIVFLFISFLIPVLYKFFWEGTM
ncbi:MAG: hypothetical protein AAF740_09955 [Bacteroidota bacterium]